MDLERTQSLTDIVHGSIAYSGIEREILGTPIFNRLHKVLQSSLVYLTYSSNKVKRFEHSVGVMDLAGKMFFMSICNTKDINILHAFLGEIKDAIIKWRLKVSSDRLGSVVPRNVQNNSSISGIKIPNCALYHQYMPGNLTHCTPEEITAYYVAFQAIRLSGLLHDVGHMPYSHVLENSVKNLYKKVESIPSKNRTYNQQEFLSIMSNYCAASVKDKDEIHEEIGKICAVKIFQCVSSAITRTDENLFFIATYDFACSILQSTPDQNTIYSDLHQIVAGVVDADRLDYCTRDALCAGTRTDIINYERLFSTYSLCLREIEHPLQKTLDTPSCQPELQGTKRTKRFYFCPHVKNVPLIEDLLRRRWSIFSSINYHHRVHKHEILLEEVISKLGSEELSESEKIPDLTPGSLPLKISSIWKLISLLKTNVPPEYSLIQFDDSWLDTLLKKKYFDIYKENFMWNEKHAQDPLWNQMDELISAQKHYFSVFKRREEFKQFDEVLFEKFCSEKNFEKWPSIVVDEIKEVLDKTDRNYGKFLVNKGSFFFNWIILNPVMNIALLNDAQQSLYKKIESKLKVILLKGNKAQDCILRDCTFKSGFATGKNSLYVVDNTDAKPINYYSNLEQTLRIERGFSAPFHLYYLPKWVPQGNGYWQNLDTKADIYPALVNATFKSLKEVVKRRK